MSLTSAQWKQAEAHLRSKGVSFSCPCCSKPCVLTDGVVKLAIEQGTPPTTVEHLAAYLFCTSCHHMRLFSVNQFNPANPGAGTTPH